VIYLLSLPVIRSQRQNLPTGPKTEQITAYLTRWNRTVKWRPCSVNVVVVGGQEVPLQPDRRGRGRYLVFWNQSSLNESFRSSPSYRRKPVSRSLSNSWIPARATPDYDPGLAGMTPELFSELQSQHTSSADKPCLRVAQKDLRGEARIGP